MGVAKEQHNEYLRYQADLSRGYGAYLYVKSAATNTRGAVGQNANKQKRLMAMILNQLPQLSQSEWNRRCERLYASDSILGPEAVAWGLELIARVTPPGIDRNTVLEQMDNAKSAAHVMRKIRKGWQGFGVDDPIEIIYDLKTPVLARYNSEPILHCQTRAGSARMILYAP